MTQNSIPLTTGPNEEGAEVADRLVDRSALTTGQQAACSMDLSRSAPTDTHRSVLSRYSTVFLAFILFVNMLPVTMVVPTLSKLKTTLDATSFWTHAFMSVNMIAAVLAAPLGAALSDRLARRKPILIGALIINAVLLWVMGYLCAVHPVLSTLLVIRFCEGAVHIVAVTTIMAMACDWAPSDKRGRTMGAIGASLMFGTACGSMLGGRIGNASIALVFHVGAYLVIGAAIFAAIALRDAPERKRASGLRESLQLLSVRPQLLVPYAYAFIDRFCVGVIVSTLMLYLGGVAKMSPGQIGGLLALFLFPFALLCYPVGRLADKYGRVLPMCVGSIGFGIVYALYGVIPLGWLPGAMLASGVFSAIMFAPNLAMCSDLAPANARATAFAGFNMAGSLGFMAGPILGGLICSIWEPSGGSAFAYKITFIIAGSTEVLCALLTLPWLLKMTAKRAALAR